MSNTTKTLQDLGYVQAKASPFLTAEELRTILGGREPHRLDGWRREWLTDGWRPLLKDEFQQVGDMCSWTAEPGKWHHGISVGKSVKKYPYHHFRTRRPLPPTTEPNKVVVPCPICAGDGVVRKPEGSSTTPDRESPPQEADVPSEEVKFLKESMARVAQEFGISTPFVLMAMAETNEQTYTDILIKHIQSTRQEERSRAEQAEKKLAEVEKELAQTTDACWDYCRLKDTEILTLRQKLQQSEASVPRWMPVSERLPTKEDALSGWVWVIQAGDGPFCRLWDSVDAHASHWMTPIPLPTPTEEKEDAFERFWTTSPHKLIAPKEEAEIIFLAGQQSNK